MINEEILIMIDSAKLLIKIQEDVLKLAPELFDTDLLEETEEAINRLTLVLSDVGWVRDGLTGESFINE